MPRRHSIAIATVAIMAWAATATGASSKLGMPGPEPASPLERLAPSERPALAALIARSDPSRPAGAGSAPSRGVWKTPFVAPKLPEAASREAIRAALARPIDSGDGYFHRGRRIRLLREPGRALVELRPGASAEDLRRRLEASGLGLHFTVRLAAGPAGERSRLLELIPREVIRAAEAEILDLALGLPGRLRADAAVRSARPVLVEAATGARAAASARIAVRLRGNLPVTPPGAALPSRPGGAYRSPAPGDTAAQSLLSRLEKACGARRGEYLGEGTWLLELVDPSADALGAAAKAASLAGVHWAEPDFAFPLKKHFLPDDPLFGLQQHLRNTGQNFGAPGADVGAEGAWEYTLGDSGITIAVLDDGVERTHPDLRIQPGGRNYVPAAPTDNPDPVAPEDVHGTLVAGVAAGRGSNALGGSGMAPMARILPLKIAGGGQWALNSAIAKALRYAVDTGGAHVINNSWGGGLANSLIADAIVHASRNGRGGLGTPVVFSSGNDAGEYRPLYYPLWEFSPPIPSGLYRIGFRFEKDGSGSAGERLASIDHYAIRGPDGYTVTARETFASGVPEGWTASAGIPAFVATTAMHYGGTGDAQSLRSPGGLDDDGAAEILAPLRGFDAGESLQLMLRLAGAPGDRFTLRVYDSAGNVVGTAAPERVEPTERVDSLAFPADADSAIAVGASTELDYRAGYSQYRVSGSGRTVDFVAPSNGAWNGVTTTDRTGADGLSDGDYTIGFGGTSASAPLASGVMALILSRRPDLTRAEVLDALKAACDKIGGVAYAGGVHREYGHGRLNARRAMEILDRPPVLAPVGNQAGSEGQALAFTLSASDPDGDAVAFSGLDLPAGASVAGNAFSWTPGPAQAGNHTVRLVARAHALADTESVVITVGEADMPPEIAAIPDTAIDEARTLQFTVTAVEPDGEPIEWSWQGGPAGASFQAGNFSWTPSYADSGLYAVRFIARAGALSDTEEVRIRVRNVDRPPALTVPGPRSAGEGALVDFPVSAADPDGDPIFIAVAGMPPGAAFDGSRFLWRPGYDQAGDYRVRFHAVAGELVDSQDVAITVRDGGSGTGALRLFSDAGGPGTLFLAMPAADGPGSPLGRDTVIFEAAVGTYFFTAIRPGFRPARFAARVRGDTLFDVPVRLKPHIPWLAGSPVPLSLDGAALTGLDQGAAAADLDYDGRQDMAVLGPAGLRFLRNVDSGDGGEGAYAASQAVRFDAAAFAGLHAFTVDDWDDDGWFDVIAALRDGRVLRVSARRGSLADTVPVYRDTLLLVDRPGKTCHPHVSDRDGDGRKDLHLLCAEDGLWIYRNTGSAGVPALAAAPQEVRSADGDALANLSSPVWLDADGDGHLDLLAFQDGRLKSFLARPGEGTTLAFAPGQAVNLAGSKLDCAACRLALRPVAGGMPHLLSFAPGRGAQAHRLRLLGDLDGNGKVDAADRTLLLGAWESRDTDPAWNPALNLALDPERGERIDVRDLGAFGDSWGMEE